MASHQDARAWAIAGTEAALGREPTLLEVQFVQAVAWLESNYGAGWKGAGVGSWNMGAVQAKPLNPPCAPGKKIECDPATSFVNADSRPNADGTSTPYECCYRKYPTPEAGMQHVADILYNRMKIQPTSIEAVSTQMYDKHYYEGFGATREERIAKHVDRLNAGLEKITAALDEPMPPYSSGDETDTGDDTGMLMFLGAGAALLVGGFIWTNRRL